MKLYFSENDDWIEYEAQKKGYRLDVFVETNDKLYSCAVYDPIRLSQDFRSEFEQYGFFDIPNNLVLVDTVCTASILSTANQLEKSGYFDKLLPNTKISLQTLVQVL